MAKSSDVVSPQFILPIRFTVQTSALEHIGAHTLTIDWMNDARFVLENLATQKKTNNNKVYLPTVSLDTALSALNPVVAHGYRSLDDKKGISYTLTVNEQPNPALIANLSAIWADTWAKNYFPDRLAHTDFRELRERMATPSIWHAISAHAALYDKEHEKLRYSVIPSILSALFVNGGPSGLGGRIVNWGLAQQAGNNGWQIISDPFQARNGATYAYLVRFSVQYQPRINEPRIHTAIICQRYADNPVVDNASRRRISMLCRFGRPLMTQGIRNDNMIRLVTEQYGQDPISFGAGLSEILGESQARTLANPGDIFENPQKYRGLLPEEDRYLIIHFEGLETERDYGENGESNEETEIETSGTHGVGTGFSLSERWDIYQTITERLGHLLKPSCIMPRIKAGRPLRSVVWSRASEGKNANSEKYLASFQRANCGKARILLLYRSNELGEVMEFFVRRLFHMGTDEGWPGWLDIICERIPDELGRKLEIPGIENGKSTGANRMATEQAMSAAWVKFLEKYKADRLYAWIELPPGSDFTSPHDAIRDACIRVGAVSQMISAWSRKFSPDVLMSMQAHYRSAAANKEFGRMFNAVADLLIRSSGSTIRDELQRDAVSAGFPKSIAEKLCVIGLTVFQANTNFRVGRGSVIQPLAVRMNMDGVMQVFWEDNWIDYYAATIQIGKLFADTQRRKKVYDETVSDCSKRINDYTQNMLRSIRNIPSLLIVDAVKTRRWIKAFRVGDLDPCCINVNGTLFDENTHPMLSAVWARFDSPAENIQYVGQNGDGQMEKVSEQSLFLDEEAHGLFIHYFSLGRQMPGEGKTKDGYRYQLENPKTTYRYQQAIELVPFFGKQELKLASVFLTHGLRSGPHFVLSNLTAPFPIHLATKMLNDLVCLLGIQPINGND